jgi:hypothetical protein
MITEHVVQYLDDMGFGTSAVDLFADNMPPNPHDAVVIQTTGGFSPTFVHDSPGVHTELPTVQVVCRSKSIVSAKAKCFAIYAALSMIRNQQVDGVFVQRMVPMQSPFPLGRDDNDRWQWVVNFMAQKETG